MESTGPCVLEEDSTANTVTEGPHVALREGARREGLGEEEPVRLPVKALVTAN